MMKLDPPDLDAEERKLMEGMEQDIAKGHLVSRLTPERKAEIEAAARRTLNPPRVQITTRLPKQDLARLKAKAL